jgi:hypothetical protein
MKISYDFDGTLGEDWIQEIAKSDIAKGHEVYITTARFSHSSMPLFNRDLDSVAQRLGIPKERIRFTDGSLKNKYLEGFNIHYDDCEFQLDEMKDIEGLTRILVTDDMNLVRL